MRTNKHFFASFFFLTCIIGMSVFAVSCKDDDSTSSSKYISGTLSFNMDDYYPVGLATTFTATHKITSPTTMDSVTLVWVANNFSPNMNIGEQCNITFPNTVGTYSVSLVASADDYMHLSRTNSTIVIPATFFEAVTKLTPASDTLTDIRDGEKYPFRRIGNLDWFVRNLNWDGAGRDYKDQAGYGIIFGRYYTWLEATTAAICPAGWHVPTNNDWEDLGQALGGSPVSFTTTWKDLGKKVAVDAKLVTSTSETTTMWPYDVKNTKENTEGWNALPSGGIFDNASRGKFSSAYWWSASENTNQPGTGYYRYITSTSADFMFNYADTTGVYFPVRCVRN